MSTEILGSENCELLGLITLQANLICFFHSMWMRLGTWTAQNILQSKSNKKKRNFLKPLKRNACQVSRHWLTDCQFQPMTENLSKWTWRADDTTKETQILWFNFYVFSKWIVCLPSFMPCDTNTKPVSRCLLWNWLPWKLLSYQGNACKIV